MIGLTLIDSIILDITGFRAPLMINSMLNHVTLLKPPRSAPPTQC